MHRSALAGAPSLITLLALGALAGARAAAEDAPSFHITLIGSFPGRSQAVAITSQGEVAVWGQSSTSPPARVDTPTSTPRSFMAWGEAVPPPRSPSAVSVPFDQVSARICAGGLVGQRLRFHEKASRSPRMALVGINRAWLHQVAMWALALRRAQDANPVVASPRMMYR